MVVNLRSVLIVCTAMLVFLFGMESLRSSLNYPVGTTHAMAKCSCSKCSTESRTGCESCKCGCEGKFIQESSFKACLNEVIFTLFSQPELMSYNYSVLSFTDEPISLVSPPPRYG